MFRDLLKLDFLDRYPDAGTLALRLFFAFVLIYGTQDNIFGWDRMLEFRDFLGAQGFPFPLVSAHVSVYAQFTCGILILVGLFTRLASLIMVINFLVALGMVHLGLPFDANIAPLAMFFMGIFFLLHGAGRYSLDARMTTAGPETRRTAA